MKCKYALPILCLAAWGALNQAQAACTAPVLLAPAHTEISEASPRFEWAPVSDASHYLVWLESRLPEGRVLLSQELQTRATYLIPPRPLTNGRATVRLRVTAVCKDGNRAELSARLRIAEDGACRLKAEPVAERDKGRWNVRWEALPFAQRYEVRLHATEDGKPIFVRDSAGSQASVGSLRPGAWLLAVQPVCRGLKGVTSWITVDSVPE